MSTSTTRAKNGDTLSLRWTMREGFELRCPNCHEWWELSIEFWRANEWSRCLVCWREYQRLWIAMRRLDEGYQQRHEGQRRYRLQLKRLYPELVAVHDREMASMRKRKRRAALRAQAA